MIGMTFIVSLAAGQPIKERIMPINKIKERISAILNENDDHLDALIITDDANLTYVTGVQLQLLASIPYLSVILFWSKNSRTLICPSALASTYTSQGWKENLIIYAECADPQGAAIAHLLQMIQTEFKGRGNLGYIGESLSGKTLSQLTEALPNSNFMDISDSWIRLREIKTEEEIDNLSEAAKLTDHGIAGAIHHLSTLQSKTEKFLTEDIRVHSLERGIHIGGYDAVSQAVPGEKADRLWPNAPAFGIGTGFTYNQDTFVRLEMLGIYNNYRSNDSRILYTGVLNQMQMDFFSKIKDLRTYACSVINPGIAASKVYENILSKSKELGINVLNELGFGHGIGIEPVEPPYISAADDGIIAENMTLILKLAVRYLHGEILVTKDTLIVKPDGCQIVGRYQNWDIPYQTAYTF